MSFIFSLVTLLWFALFHYVGQGIFTLFWLSFFLMIWACLLVFEFFGLFCLFSFLIVFSSFFHWNFHLLLVWGVIIVRIFHEKKFIQAKKEATRDIFLLKCERDNKNNLSLFHVQTVKINKLWSRLVWWFRLCKEMHFISLWTTNPLHTIMYIFKTPDSRVMVWGWLFIFLFIYYGLKFSHLNEGVVWFICQYVVLNKHQIIFEIKSKFIF